MNRKVAIHQPNFFPWLGFFDKLQQSDLFVIMDTAQIPNKKPSYQNRVQLMIENEARWSNSISIKKRDNGVLPIKDVVIMDQGFSKKKFLKTIKFYYRKAPFFNEAVEILEPLILNSAENLCDYNVNAIYGIMDILDMDKGKVVLSSQIGFEMSKENLNQVIIDIVRRVNGDVYLSGEGSRLYMEKDIFIKNNIELSFQTTQFVYNQFNSETFVPGLSIIDALMNIGKEKVKNLIIK